jgi:hypothetical protein
MKERLVASNSRDTMSKTSRKKVKENMLAYYRHHRQQRSIVVIVVVERASQPPLCERKFNGIGNAASFFSPLSLTWLRERYWQREFNCVVYNFISLNYFNFILHLLLLPSSPHDDNEDAIRHRK